MKFLFLSCITILLLASCSKSVDSPPVVDAGTYIKFKINGTPYQWKGDTSRLSSTGIYARKFSFSFAGDTDSYQFNGRSGADEISLQIVTDSLKLTSYPSAWFVDNNSRDIQMTLIRIGETKYNQGAETENTNIKITRYSSNSIDGTFSGQVSSFRSDNNALISHNVAITDGEFKNVPITYVP